MPSLGGRGPRDSEELRRGAQEATRMKGCWKKRVVSGIPCFGIETAIIDKILTALLSQPTSGIGSKSRPTSFSTT